MKTTMRLISLLICFELIAGSFHPELSLVLIKNSFAQTTSCPAGQQMDATLNRCLTPPETAKVMNAVASCPQGDSACYKNLAQSALDQKVASGEAKAAVNGGLFSSNLMQAAAVAVPITVAVGGLVSGPPSQCAAASYWAMIGGAASLFAGDLIANMQHKKRLKEIEQKWNEIAKPSTGNADDDKIQSMETQSEAFELLAQSEESLAKAAKMKSTFYMIATLAFTAAAGIALMEGMGVQAITFVCKPQDTDENSIDKGDLMKILNKGSQLDPTYRNPKDLFWEIKVQRQVAYNISQARSIAEFHILSKEGSSVLQPSPEEFFSFKKNLTKLEDRSVLTLMKNTFKTFALNIAPFPSAHAQMAGVAGAAAGAAAGYAFSGYVKDMMVSPWSRAAVGGVMAGMTMIMYSHAKSQAEASTNRAEVLRKMKADLLSNSGAINTCASADRDDPAKPNCYCYTSDNQRNPNRTSSDVCNKLWGEKNFGTGTYTALAASSFKGCISNTKQFDQNCACKTNNSCMKVPVTSLQGVTPGTMSMYAQGVQPVNQVASGNFGAANMDAGSLANQAVKLNAANKQLLNKLPAKDQAKLAALTKQFENSAMKAGAGQSPNLLSSSLSNMPTNPKEAAAMLSKELKKSDEGPQGISRNGNTIAAPSNEGKKDLEFGLTPEDLAAQETQVAEVMKQDLDYNASDINESSKTNLFEVLSNRYQRSGMRRLFDEKGTTTADKPASSDIVK